MSSLGFNKRDRESALRPATLDAMGRAAIGTMVYLEIERLDARRLLAALRDRLAARDLVLAQEGPAHWRIAARAVPPQERACVVPRCGGAVRRGDRCGRCHTAQGLDT